MVNLLVAVLLLVIGAVCLLPLIPAVRSTRPAAQSFAVFLAGLGATVYVLCTLTPVIVVDDLTAGLLVGGLYGLGAEAGCTALAAGIAVAARPRRA